MLLSREDFFRHRIDRVKETASLHSAMIEYGAEPRFEDRSAQMRCCFSTSHAKSGKDLKPSARYYPAGERDDYETYYCWVCTERPLDVIGFIQRAREASFVESLRYLEQQYRIRYDDIELAADVADELKGISNRVVAVDPKRQFAVCEAMLRTNRTSIGLKRFVRVSYVLDKIYFMYDDEKPGPTNKRLLQWIGKVRDMLPPEEDFDAAR